jgi:hypothetical protein
VKRQTRRLFVLVGVVLLVMPASMGVGAADQVIGEPELSFDVAQRSYDAGSDAQVALTITNRGKLTTGGDQKYEDRVTTARALVLSIDDSQIPLEADVGSVAVGNVPTGAVTTDPITVTIPKQTPPGTYELPITYEYAYTRFVNYDAVTVEYGDYVRSETTTVTIEVASEPQFRVTATPTGAQVGETETVSFAIENVGSAPAYNTEVTAQAVGDELTFGPGSASSTAVVSGRWDPGQTQRIDYTVNADSDAVARTYSAQLELEYTDSDGIEQTAPTLVTGIPVAEERGDRFRVEAVTSRYEAGSSGEITLEVTNIDDAPMREIQAKVFPDDPLSSDDDEAFIPRLEPGETAEVTFQLGVAGAALEKTYPLKLDFQFDTEDDDTKVSNTYRVPIEVTPPAQSGLGIGTLLPVILVVGVLGAGVVLWRRRG